MKTTYDRRIEPAQVSPEMLRQLDSLMHERGRPTLVGPQGERVELPDALHDVLAYVVEAMKRKQAIFILPEDEALTTAAAAKYLGMSRPYLLRLLDAGKIPFHRVGTHRRILFRDLAAFQEQRSRERKAALSQLTKELDEAGLYDRFIDPEW